MFFSGKFFRLVLSSRRLPLRRENVGGLGNSAAFLLFVLGFLNGTVPTHAAIVVTGDVFPSYNGTDDPWSADSTLIGNFATGSVEIDSGSFVGSTTGQIGVQPGSVGTVTVAEAGSEWLAASFLRVGEGGTGVLNIESGGRVNSRLVGIGFNPGSNGTVTVSGIGSQWNNTSPAILNVGERGTGTLNVEAGALVSNEGFAYIGTNAGANGIATVSGAGSQWNGPLIQVGRNGSGTLNIAAGGVVNSPRGLLAFTAGSSGEVTISGMGSQWNATQQTLNIGFGGAATLGIEAGGQLNSNGAAIGVNGTSSGRVNVSGAGSQWINSSYLVVGRSGVGTLTIENDGLVRVGGNLSIEEITAGSSIDMASGGMLALLGNLDSSLDLFLDEITGRGSIRYWDNSVSDWADITGATEGVDYNLALGSGDLAGYTVLTVFATIPEPATWMLLVASSLGLALRPRQRTDSSKER